MHKFNFPGAPLWNAEREELWTKVGSGQTATAKCRRNCQVQLKWWKIVKSSLSIGFRFIFRFIFEKSNSESRRFGVCVFWFGFGVHWYGGRGRVGAYVSSLGLQDPPPPPHEECDVLFQTRLPKRTPCLVTTTPPEHRAAVGGVPGGGRPGRGVHGTWWYEPVSCWSHVEVNFYGFGFHTGNFFTV